MDKLLGEVPPILILCVVIALVIRRLPRIDVGHTDQFRRRRVLNWLPLGLTYAFLYMGPLQPQRPARSEADHRQGVR